MIAIKDQDTKPHPGPWRITRVDSGVAGLLIAVGFLVMGPVTMPVLLLAAIPVGVAWLLRFSREEY